MFNLKTTQELQKEVKELTEGVGLISNALGLPEGSSISRILEDIQNLLAQKERLLEKVNELRDDVVAVQEELEDLRKAYEELQMEYWKEINDNLSNSCWWKT